LIGERAFAKSEQKKRDLNGNNDFRPLVAYSEILRQLLNGTDLSKKIHLDHPVTKITKLKDRAQIECTLPSGRKRTFFAKQVVLSIPLGVLQGRHKSSVITFEPEMPDMFKSISHLHMGHVQRLLFIFKNRFWENLNDKEPVSFLRAGPEHYFPTWWTLNPVRAPYLLAWQGGPKAQEMSEWTNQERIDTALGTLSQLTKRSKSFLRDHLKSVHQHNWSKDPFTMGAYTYTGILDSGQHHKVPACFNKFLWLTGEAFAEADGQGTVHGALEHGHEVAQKILKWR
jgi:monoamine oxidase